MSYPWELFLHYLQGYYWFEKITVSYITKLTQLHFWTTFLGEYHVLPDAFLRLAGMPRRIQIILIPLHFGMVSQLLVLFINNRTLFLFLRCFNSLVDDNTKDWDGINYQSKLGTYGTFNITNMNLK